MPDTPAFDLDAALSADLDGDLAGFIDDAGLPAAVIHSALAEPHAISRRAEIEHARAQLARPVDPLDDVTRRRLLATTSASASEGDLRSSTRSSSSSAITRSRWAAGLAAAAVVGVVLIGTGIFLGTRDSGGGDASSKATGASSPAGRDPSGDLGDLGPLDQQSIDGLAGKDPAGPAGSATADAAPEASGGQDSSARQRSTFTAGPSATPEQVQACREYYGSRGQVRFTASVTYDARPAAVIGIGNGARTIVFVVAAENCTNVLYSASTGG